MEGHTEGRTCPHLPFSWGKFFPIDFAIRTSKCCKITLLSLSSFLLTQALVGSTLRGAPARPQPTSPSMAVGTRKILRNSDSLVCKKCWGPSAIGKLPPTWNFLLSGISCWQDIFPSMENRNPLRIPSLGGIFVNGEILKKHLWFLAGLGELGDWGGRGWIKVAGWKTSGFLVFRAKIEWSFTIYVTIMLICLWLLLF